MNPNSMPQPTYVNLDYVFYKIYEFFSTLFSPSYHIPYLGTGFLITLTVLSIFFIFIITYSFVRLLEIRKREHEYLHHEIEEYAHKHKEQEKKSWERGGGVSSNARWNVVLQYLFSENAGDWKLAIIEADSMLEGLMNQLGFKGDNLGEKLKGADRDSFRSLSTAWEVHLVRNRIAHEGQQFELSQHEAKRIIALYEQIFREFGYI
ncbi:MAG: hypothetical protein WCG28_02275 [bacterium]